MFGYRLVFSPTSNGWTNCLSSDKNPSHYPPIVSYISIFWLKHKSLNFKTSISYSSSIVVPLSHPAGLTGLLGLY